MRCVCVLVCKRGAGRIYLWRDPSSSTSYRSLPHAPSPYFHVSLPSCLPLSLPPSLFPLSLSLILSLSPSLSLHISLSCSPLPSLPPPHARFANLRPPIPLRHMTLRTPSPSLHRNEIFLSPLRRQIWMPLEGTSSALSPSLSPPPSLPPSPSTLDSCEQGWCVV